MQLLLRWLTSPTRLYWFFERFFHLSGYRKGEPATLGEARSVLIVQPGHLGDVILNSAFLREFRRNWPEADITMLVDPASRQLVEACPYINHIEVYSRFVPCRLGRLRRFFKEINWARQHLWPRRFDLAIVPCWDTQIYRETILAYLSGAKWRVGFPEAGNVVPRGDEESYEFLLTHRGPSGPPGHETQKTLDLLVSIGGTIFERRTEVWVDPRASEYASSVLPDSSAVRVVMVLGSSAINRCWPAERFGEIAAWMTNDLGWQVVLVGAPGEIPLGRTVQSHCPGLVNLIGCTSVAQTMGVIERCNLYVGNDTGPMHMASALTLPVVEISSHPLTASRSHSRSPYRFGVWESPVWVAQPPVGLDDCREFCIPGEKQGELHCFLSVTTEQVKGLVLEAADQTGLRVLSKDSAEHSPTPLQSRGHHG